MQKSAALLVLVGALVGCQSESAPLVLRGQPDAADPAVVAVRMGGDHYCTGTVVGPRHVLTAAHCFDKVGPVAVSTRNADIFRAGPWKPATRVHIAPGWSPGAWESDIALVELADPIAVAPVPINVDRTAARAVDHVRVVGYGRTGTTRLQTAGTKRTADVPVRPESVFYATQPGQGTCFGDSGGPSFATIGGVETVVAVTSHAIDSECEHGSRVVRTDVHRAFLARHLDTLSFAPSRPSTPVPPIPRVPPSPPVAANPPALPPLAASGVECTDNQVITLSHTTISVTRGPAIRASGSCIVTLIDVDVRGPIGIEASGSALVIMTGGTIDASKKTFTTAGSAMVNLVGTRVAPGV